MKKWISRILKLVVTVIIISYFTPTKQADFFELYDKEDAASKSLKEFLQRPTKIITVNDIDWKYYTSYKKDKTILFIHRMGGAYKLWWQQVAAFENDYTVITFSLPEPIATIEDATNGILKILEKENIDTLYVVGTSMGGYIAQNLVHKIPNRIKKIVFSNTFPPNDMLAKDNASKSKIIPYFPEILITKFRNDKLKNDLIPTAKDSELLAAFLPSLPFSKKQFVNRFYVVIDPFTSTPQKPEIKRIPKLIIESDNDPLVKKELREQLKTLYADARLKTFHNERHFPYINAADEYNQTLKAFFESE